MTDIAATTRPEQGGRSFISLDTTAIRGATNRKRYYTSAPDVIGGIVCRDASGGGGQKLFYHYDRLGTPVAVTDANGGVVMAIPPKRSRWKSLLLGVAFLAGLSGCLSCSVGVGGLDLQPGDTITVSSSAGRYSVRLLACDAQKAAFLASDGETTATQTVIFPARRNVVDSRFPPLQVQLEVGRRDSDNLRLGPLCRIPVMAPSSGTVTLLPPKGVQVRKLPP